MTLNIRIDHLVVLAPDLEAARTAFTDAGFTATPIARHSEAMGTANSCIMLEGAYIEVMGMVNDTPANEGWRELLATGAGLKGIALASDDIDETAKMLEAKNIKADPPRHFSRPMPEGELRFSVIRLPRDLTPGLQCIYCQHHTRDLLWTADVMRHANGAHRIVAASAPGIDALQPFASASGLPMSEAGEGSIVIAMREPVSIAHLAAIEATSGILIEQRVLS